MATREHFIGESASRSFEKEWPALARRLDGFLTAKGVDPWLRGEAIQETGTRIFRGWSRLDHSRPLWNLVATIAIRLVIDERRRSSKIELVPEAPPSAGEDVEVRALQRVQLERTRAALEQLGTDHRRVLLAEIGEAAAPEGSRNRINVLRLRARLALKKELGPLVPGGVMLRVRRLNMSMQRRLSDWGCAADIMTASIASIAVATTLFLMPPASDSQPGQRIPRDAALVSMSKPLTSDIDSSYVRGRSGHTTKRVDDPGGTDAQTQDAQGIEPVVEAWEDARATYNQGRRKANKTKNNTWNEALETYREGHETAMQEKETTTKTYNEQRRRAVREIRKLPPGS